MEIAGEIENHIYWLEVEVVIWTEPPGPLCFICLNGNLWRDRESEVGVLKREFLNQVEVQLARKEKSL